MKRLLCVMLCFTAFACKEKPSDPTNEAPVAPPPTIESALPKAAAPDPATMVVPTEEDFEAEAEQTISSKNLNEELDKLEREIGTL